MGLHLDDLPADVRKRVAAADVPRAKPSRAQASGGMPLACRVCDKVIANPSERRLTKHSATHPGARSVRYEMVVA